MYKFIDLFAGAGGLSLGFEETEKFKVKAFVENNKNAVRSIITKIMFGIVKKYTQ